MGRCNVVFVCNIVLGDSPFDLSLSLSLSLYLFEGDPGAGIGLV